MVIIVESVVCVGGSGGKYTWKFRAKIVLKLLLCYIESKQNALPYFSCWLNSTYSSSSAPPLWKYNLVFYTDWKSFGLMLASYVSVLFSITMFCLNFFLMYKISQFQKYQGTHTCTHCLHHKYMIKIYLNTIMSLQCFCTFVCIANGFLCGFTIVLVKLCDVCIWNSQTHT